MRNALQAFVMALEHLRHVRRPKCLFVRPQPTIARPNLSTELELTPDLGHGSMDVHGTGRRTRLG